MGDDHVRARRLSIPNEAAPRRRYRLGARAAGQALTRRRIAEAALELHETVGPSRTTISAIAERAGVERLTVYRHFPDERALYAACSSRFDEDHPRPDMSSPMRIAHPLQRLEAVLLTLYGYYRETEPMLTALLRDAPVVPAVAESLAPYDAMLRELAEALADALAGGTPSPEQRAVVAHALAFSTWRSLAIENGLTDGATAAMMTRLVNGADSARAG